VQQPHTAVRSTSDRLARVLSQPLGQTGGLIPAPEPAARSLSVREAVARSGAEAFELFREARWSRHADPGWPNCGVADRYWSLRSRERWRCWACAQAFPVTSGKNFAHYTLPVCLGAGALYTHTAKGISALRMACNPGVK
jgi:hypothetical protein